PPGRGPSPAQDRPAARREVVDGDDPARRRALGGVEPFGDSPAGPGVGGQVGGERGLPPQLVSGILVGGDAVVGGDAEPPGDGQGEGSGGVVVRLVTAFRRRPAPVFPLFAHLRVLVVLVVDDDRRGRFGQQRGVGPQRFP